MRLALATAFFLLPFAASGQALSVLHIRITLVDADAREVPVPRHALLISDDPPTATPRRYVTKQDGTADVSLRPGSYIVESDEPLAFRGQSYQWTQVVKIVAGSDGVLALTADNAEIGPLTSGAVPMATPDTDPLLLLQPWQPSVVALWTPTARASGFVVDARGLIATSQRVVGNATAVEVQITATVKVAGRVLVADPGRDVAVLWVDPKATASLKPIPLGCELPARPALVEGQKIFAMSSPWHDTTNVLPGEVSRVDLQGTASDLFLADGGAGGPVFAEDGVVAGITVNLDDDTTRRRERTNIVPVENACTVVASAEAKMAGMTPPEGVPLPVEPTRSFPVEALKAAAARRTASVSPYVTSSSDFDIAFITPILAYSAQQLALTSVSGRGGGARRQDAQPAVNAALTDFDTWSAYVADIPPVLLLRVTPRMVEGFWTTVARGAAMTQGISVPSIKHFKSGFLRMRVLCGDQEVTPIHPFMLEHRVSDTETIDEGLYVFDPGALGPQCGSVKLVLYSEKEPDKADTRVVDPKVIQQVWEDFAPYRDRISP